MSWPDIAQKVRGVSKGDNWSEISNDNENQSNNSVITVVRFQ